MNDIIKYTLSLAKDSTETYFIGQYRPTNIDNFKIQIASRYINRPYGCMFQVYCENLLLASKLRTHYNKEVSSIGQPSLAVESEEKYLPIQLKLIPGKLKIRVQVACRPFNRDYGIAFDVYQIGLYNSLKSKV